MARNRKTSKTTPPEKAARTWRELQRPGNGTATSTAARRRKRATLLKASGSLLAFVIVLGGITWLGLSWYQSPEYKLGGGGGAPIQRVLLETDGVLTRDWVDLTLDIPPGTGLAEVSIFDLKDRLEAQGQVASAVVERRFPDALQVRLRERRPVGRLAVATEFGDIENYLVSAEGVVYRGFDYDPNFLRSLPYLDGVRLRRDGWGEFMPLEEMQWVTAFLDTAREFHPHLYRDWSVVILEGLGSTGPAPGSGIRVRGRRNPSARFSPDSYGPQLERLEVILRDLPGRVAPERRNRVEIIDLSLDGPVVVSFSQP